jgi:hypothetical protein
VSLRVNSRMWAVSFDIGRGTGLVVTTKGGSGIRVYEVTQSDVRIVLADGYRAATITMPNDELGGDWGFSDRRFR